MSLQFLMNSFQNCRCQRNFYFIFLRNLSEFISELQMSAKLFFDFSSKIQKNEKTVSNKVLNLVIIPRWTILTAFSITLIYYLLLHYMRSHNISRKKVCWFIFGQRGFYYSTVCRFKSLSYYRHLAASPSFGGQLAGARRAAG